MNTAHKPTLRALSVLELVAQHRHPYTLSELSATLDIPASTLLPIVHTLRDKQYLGYDEKTQTYSLGFRLFELGSMVQDTGFYAGIVDIMQTVVDGCGETCHFGILKSIIKARSPARRTAAAGLQYGHRKGPAAGLHPCTVEGLVSGRAEGSDAQHDHGSGHPVQPAFGDPRRGLCL